MPYGMTMSKTPATRTAHCSCLRCERAHRRGEALRRARIRATAVAEAVKDFTAAQVGKARELISDGGLVPTRRAGVYRSVSSDGASEYLSHWATCSCKAALHGRRCYHVCAVRIAGATRKAA